VLELDGAHPSAATGAPPTAPHHTTAPNAIVSLRRIDRESASMPRRTADAVAEVICRGYRSSHMAEDLIQPGEIAYRLELTAAQLKIVHTALKSLYDDLGHEESDFKHVVASVLDKLPGEHEIRAIDLSRELRTRRV
jgi:hypothetical protein